MHKTSEADYYVYILTNKAKTVLYVGMTDNLAEKLYHHENPEADSSTLPQSINCCYLVYWENFNDVDDAIDRQQLLKALAIQKKENLITEFNPDWKFLNGEIG